MDKLINLIQCIMEAKVPSVTTKPVIHSQSPEKHFIIFTTKKSLFYWDLYDKKWVKAAAKKAPAGTHGAGVLRTSSFETTKEAETELKTAVAKAKLPTEDTPGKQKLQS